MEQKGLSKIILSQKNINNFLAKFNRGDNDDCWNWMASSNEGGYGWFSVGERMELAHRVSYTYFNGGIPQGLLVLHSCDNPICINPHHLRVGTQQDNIDDMTGRGRHGALGKSASKETRKKMSDSKMGNKNNFWQKKHSKKSRKKISDNHADVSGENNGRAILNEKKVLEMKSLRKDVGYSWVKLGEMFGVSPDTARHAVLGITWGYLR